MKYLSNYIEDKQTALFDRLGIFFAFSNKQFDEGKKEGVKYSSLGSGIICPVGKSEEFYDCLDKIVKAGIHQDICENGSENIIKRELSNHECYYTGDVSDCVDKLVDYGITKDQILIVFRDERANHYDD